MGDASRGVNDVAQIETVPSAVLPLSRALWHFLREVLIVAGLFVLITLIGGLGWAVWCGAAFIHQGAPAGANAVSVAMSHPGPLATIVLSIWNVGGTALVMVLWRAFPSAVEGQISRAALRLRSTWRLALFAGVILVCCSLIVSQIAEAFQIKLDPTNMSLIRGTIGLHPWILFAFAAVAAPIYEELLFRRVLFRQLWQDGWPKLGAVLSGLLFAFMHESPLSGDRPLNVLLPLWLVYACMGIALAWVYRRTGTLCASIAAHGLNNAVALAMMLFFGPIN